MGYCHDALRDAGVSRFAASSPRRQRPGSAPSDNALRAQARHLLLPEARERPQHGVGVLAEEGRRAPRGVVCRRIGTPRTVTRPARGCGSVAIILRALRCGLSHTSGTLLIRPAGTPALSKRLSHSSAVRVPKISLSSGINASRFVTRLASVSKRGSVASSVRSSAAQHLAHSALLATPSVRYASAALKTS